MTMAGEIQKSSTDSLNEFLRANKVKIERALGDSIDFERFFVVAMNTIRRTPKLGQCSPSSVIDAVNRCAELGLEPGGPLGHAYLVPYAQECQLVVGYRGLLHLMFRSGGLRDASAQMVYDNDKFVGQLGTDPKIEHTITFAKRGRMIGAYCVLRYVNGGTHIETMNMEELQKVQSVSKAKSGPWTDWFEEMCKKTVLKRGAKWGPTGDGLELMARAYDYDDDKVVDSVATPVPTQPPPALNSENGVGQVVDATDRLKQSIPAEPAA